MTVPVPHRPYEHFFCNDDVQRADMGYSAGKLHPKVLQFKLFIICIEVYTLDLEHVGQDMKLYKFKKG